MSSCKGPSGYVSKILSIVIVTDRPVPLLLRGYQGTSDQYLYGIRTQGLAVLLINYIISHHLHYHLNITNLNPCTISSCHQTLTNAAKLPRGNTALSVHRPQSPAPNHNLTTATGLRSYLQPYKNPFPAAVPGKTEPTMIPLLGGLEYWGYPEQTLHSG